MALLHQISGVVGTTSFPSGLSLDEAHREAFLANGSQVDVYALDADGTVPPLRSIAVPAPIAALKYDPVRDRLLVATRDGIIAAYARDASGNATPVATLTARRSGSRLRSAVDLAAEAGKVWVLDGAGAAVSFSLGNGPEIPTEVLDLSVLLPVATLSVTPGNLFVSQWILARTGTGTGECAFPVAAADLKRAIPLGQKGLMLSSDSVTTVQSDSQACPYQSIVRRLSGFSAALDLAVDAVHRELFLLEASSISVYPLEASGAAPPLRRLSLAATDGTGSRILYDASRDRIDLLGNTTIASWPRTAVDAAPPDEMLSLSESSLEAPIAFALCQ